MSQKNRWVKYSVMAIEEIVALPQFKAIKKLNDEFIQIKKHNKTVTKLLLERNTQIAEANKILKEIHETSYYTGRNMYRIPSLFQQLEQLRRVLK